MRFDSPDIQKPSFVGQNICEMAWSCWSILWTIACLDPHLVGHSILSFCSGNLISFWASCKISPLFPAVTEGAQKIFAEIYSTLNSGNFHCILHREKSKTKQKKNQNSTSISTITSIIIIIITAIIIIIITSTTTTTIIAVSIQIQYSSLLFLLWFYKGPHLLPDGVYVQNIAAWSGRGR